MLRPFLTLLITKSILFNQYTELRIECPLRAHKRPLTSKSGDLFWRIYW